MLDKFVNARSIHKLANAKVNRMHVTKSDHLGTEPRNTCQRAERSRNTLGQELRITEARNISEIPEISIPETCAVCGDIVQTNYLVGNLRHNLLNYSFFVNQKKLTKHQPNDGY